jgi:nicotinamidase-related amidase
MRKNVVLAFGLQKTYLHKDGSVSLGDNEEIYKYRIKDYLSSLNHESNKLYLIREVHAPSDKFFCRDRTHSLVGSRDIEIPEMFKAYFKIFINTTRYNALYKTPLESEISKLNPEKIILIGFETHTNVLFTAEELRNRDYNVSVIEPLVMSRDISLHMTAISLMSDALSVSINQE